MTRASLESVKERIAKATNLEKIIAEQLPLQRRGGRLVGLCPFHDEKTPSFYLYDDHFYCFGCKASGDAIEFVRRTKGLGFIETLRYLAQKAGVAAPELDEGAKVHLPSQQNVLRVLATSQTVFTEELSTPRGAPARAYLEKRGFAAADIEQFGFGLTPEGSWGLVKILRARGLRVDDMIKASVATPGRQEDSSRPIDFFRNRITIPIKDHHGRIVGFGGRALDPSEPAKYKNSAQTPVFDKSGLLFGLSEARAVIHKKQRAVLVEGYMDALQLWRQGFGETVACMGTAFSLRQLKLLAQMGRPATLFLLFDGDQAGANATLSTIDVCLEVPQISVRVALLPKGDDPDSFVLREGAEGLEKLLAQAPELIDFVFAQKMAATATQQIPQLVRQELVPWLAKIADPVKQGFLVTKTAERTGVAARVLQQALRGKNVVLTRTTAERMPEGPLPPFLLSLLGHLYFAESQEVKVTEVQDLLERGLGLAHEGWLHAVQALLELHEKGLRPASSKAELANLISEEAIEFIEKKCSLKEQAFRGTAFSQALTAIRSQWERGEIAKRLSLLKRELLRNPIGEGYTATGEAPPYKLILEEITSLTKTLEKLSTGISS